MTRNWKRPPRKSRVWRKRKIPLRQDNAPASPMVTGLFFDLQRIRREIEAGEIDINSADAEWKHLIEYLLTAPDLVQSK